jgi:hypothetical protein
MNLQQHIQNVTEARDEFGKQPKLTPLQRDTMNRLSVALSHLNRCQAETDKQAAAEKETASELQQAAEDLQARETQS